MQLREALLVGLCGLGSASCGAGPIEVPPDPSWAIGTFSSVSEEGGVTDNVSRLVIMENGRARWDGVLCSADGVIQGEEMEWEAESDEAIVIYDAGAFGDVRVTQVDCNTIEMREVGDDPYIVGTWYRGEMCLEDLYCDPEFVECDPCQTVWCEGSAPQQCE